jgi:hypothetical protein
MTWAEEPVYFADAGLKTAVEQELWIAEPTPTDMLKLTSLNASWAGITDLTGLGYASNLQTLRVNNNQLTDISVVASLVNLCTLDVHDNGIRDISAVSNLPYLDELTIRGNNIHDLSPISGLTGLRILQASLNGISDLTPLAGLVNRQRLNLEDNQVGDLSPLFAMHKLGSLRLRNNRIEDISPLAGKNSILFQDLHGNRISDVSPLAEMTALPTLHLSQNEVRDISPLAGLSDMQFLVLKDNEIRDISALAGLTSLNHLDLRGNPLNADAYATHIPQITANNPGLWLAYDDASSAVQAIYVDFGALGDPGPNDPNVSDPWEDGSSQHPFDSIQEAIDDANKPDLAVAPDDPGAVWGEGDYHLKSQAGRYEPETNTWLQDEITSVCIDGGDPTAPVAQEPSPNGKTINMGGYGGTAEASKSHLSF